MKSTGKREVDVSSRGGGGVGSMEFEVTNIQNSLVSVKRIVEKGNKVIHPLSVEYL